MLDNLMLLVNKADACLIKAKELLGDKRKAPFAKISFFGTARQLLEYTATLRKVYEEA